ncbi:MAG: extracellular solute-binding protein [Spirochaetaceae bacterium]
MKKIFTLFLLFSLIGINSLFAKTQQEEDLNKIKLIVPHLGYNDDQITTEKARPGGLTPHDDYYIAVRKSVEEKYPDYDVDWVDWGWGEVLDLKQRALITAGDVPDILSGGEYILNYAKEGILEPLPMDIVESMNPTFLGYDSDGQAVAVAHKSSIFMLFYNKDLMVKAGLDPEQPPKTWAEFKSMSDAITKAGNGEFYGGGIPTFPHYGGSLRATPFFRQKDTDFATADGQSNLSDPALMETLEFIRVMNNNFPPGLGNNSDEGPLWSAFQNTQTVAFVINGTWQASSCIRKGMNWGVAVLPVAHGGINGNCLVGSVFNSVPKAGKNREASFNLIREALSVENQKIMLEDTNAVGLNEIINDPSYYDDNATLISVMDALRNGEYSSIATFAKNSSAVWEIVHQKVLARLTMTNDPISEIIKDAEKEITPLLK